MKILLALGRREDTGGPTAYAKNLAREFAARGHTVHFVSYGPLLWRLPSGLRHLLYACKLLPYLVRSDAALGFDTMTVGVPLMAASALARRPFCLRIGGDFVWEQYVERTGDLIKFSRFYDEARGRLSRKERLMIALTRTVVCRAARTLFNSAWQSGVWQAAYGIAHGRAGVLENVYPPRREGPQTSLTERVFVAAGRPIKLKQEGVLKEIFKELRGRYPDIVLDTKALPPAEHQARVASCYATITASVSEMAPNSVIDAVAYGKPFICTDDTGIKERLAGTGLFVDTGDRAALKRAIESLLDPAEYARVQQRVQDFAFTRTWADVAEDALAHLKNLA